MSEFIVCVTEEEPAGFHPVGTRGVSVRLSVATEEADDTEARARILDVLDTFETVGFAVFVRTTAGAWQNLDAPKVKIVAEAADVDLRTAFKAWLAAYRGSSTVAAEGSFFAKAGAATLPDATGKVAPIVREARNADAHDVVLGTASQTAPVPQKLHLAFVLRLDLSADAGAIAVVPVVAGAALAGLNASGDQVRVDYTAPVSAGTASIVGCSTTVTKPLGTLNTLIDPITGFVAIGPSDPAAFAALRRFESRAGSLFNAALAAADIDWPAVPPSGNAEQDALAFAVLTVRRLAWQAVTTLSCTLDTILIALAMPGRERRDGALLAPFLDDLEAALRTAPDPPDWSQKVRRSDLRSAFRAGLKQLTILQPPGAGDGSKQREDFVVALSLACGFERGKNDWVSRLLSGYVGFDSAARWQELAGQGARLALPGRDWDFAREDDRHAFAAALDRDGFMKALARELERQVSDLRDSLTGEEGAERTILRLLDDAKLKDVFATALQAKLGLADGSKATILAVYAEALASFRRDVSTRLDGADAARRAAGSLLADRLTAMKLGDVPKPDSLLKVERLVARARSWDFWAHRFATNLEESKIDDVFSALARPVAKPTDYFAARTADGAIPVPADGALGTSPISALEAIGRAAAGMQGSVLDDLFPPGTARFVPDAAPRGLPVQISVDPSADDEDDVDEFAAAFAGLALLVRARGEWAYGNLAEVLVVEPARPPKAGSTIENLTDAAILPLPTTLNDGRRELFVTYDGRPFASSAFDLSVPGSESARRFTPFFTTDYPLKQGAGGALPPLAYATDYTLAVHALGRSGSLPFDLQSGPASDTVPWRPEGTITLPADDACKLTLSYSRTTAIGRVSITDSGQTRRIGIVPDGVRPLSADDPRIASGVGGAPLDLFRNADGTGAIALPEPGGVPVSITLRDVRRWGGGADLIVDVMADPRTLPSASGLARLQVPLPDHRLHAITIRIDRTDTTQAMTIVEVDGIETGKQQLSIPHATGSLWLRSFVSGAAGAAIALADPAPDAARSGAAAGRGHADNLLLLGGGPSPEVWRPPFHRDAETEIVFPRVSSLDFERWISNPELRDQFFHGVDQANVQAFRELLLAAEIDRAANPDVARLLDHLPDPAVASLRIEVVPLDGLRSLPSQLAGGSYPAVTEWVVGSALSEVMKKQATNLLSGKIGEVLAAIDAAFRVKLRVTAREFPASQSWIAPRSADGEVTIRVPTGMTAAATIRPVVWEERFVSSGTAPAAIDKGIRQLAVAAVKDGAGKPSLLFEGARLQVEAMTGPLVETPDVAYPWRADRAAWTDLAHRLVEHEPAGQARVYDLAVTPPRDPPDAENTWLWRRLQSVDVATQRWRFMGRPIYSWISPRNVSTAKADVSPRASVKIDFDPAVEASEQEAFEAFEQEAFEDRDDADAEIQTATLQPFGSRSRLVTVPWELPSATLFRHRLTLRSRHAGALAREADGLCSAWPERQSGDEPNLDLRGKAWLRIAMLADRARITLTRPQLRALIPLTASPGDGFDPVPPVLAIIQERPFDWGGLADRVAAEIHTAVGYWLEPVPQPKEKADEEVVIPGDLRREIGPDPRLSYAPFDADQASRAVLIAEGPIGLTFDDSAGRAPAFPNSALVLQPGVLRPGSELVGTAPASLEEHFLSVSLRRYLDPGWLVGEPETAARFDFCWWGESRDVPVEIRLGADDASSLSVLTWKVDGDFIEASLHSSVIDPSVDQPTGEDRRGPRPPASRLRLCRVPADLGHLAILHQPLDARRASLSIFCVPEEKGRHGGGNLPILCGGIAWSIPDRFSPSDFRLVPENALVTPVAASEATATNWVRTNRDFETVWAVPPGEAAAARIEVAELTGRLRAVGPGAMLSFATKDAPSTQAAAWIRAPQATKPFPTHAQRHVAALLSRTLPGPGRETERLTSAHLVPTREIGGVAVGPDRARLMEFEVVAAVLGWSPTIEAIPLAYRFARFDLTAIGFDANKGTQYLSVFGRLLGSSAALGGLRSLALTLRADTPKATAIPISIPIAATVTAAAFVLDLSVVDGVCKAPTGILIDDSGAATQIDDHRTDETTLLPADRTQGLVLAIDGPPTFSGGATDEIWIEVAMLASRREGCGFAGELDYDWFFGAKPPPSEVGVAVKEGDLRDLPEAQARVVAVSPPFEIEH